MRDFLPSVRSSGWLTRPGASLFEPFFGDFGVPAFAFEREAWAPPFDVAETDNEVIVRAEIPGMDEKDVEINLSSGVLTVSGEKKAETFGNETCHCMESCYGKFSRTMMLPFEVEVDKVDATFKNGVLRIRLPKSETAKPRKIEIKT